MPPFTVITAATPNGLAPGVYMDVAVLERLKFGHDPEPRGTDDEIWRHVRLIPFEVPT